MRFARTVATCILGTLVISASSIGAVRAQEDDWEKTPYILKDGKIDYGAYNGFRRYHNTCHVCHGPDALGSTFGPTLKDSMKTLSYDEFLDVVTNGRKVKVPGGGDSVMPSFGENADVMLYIDHIYAYLKARADGAVGRGRPQRLPADEDPVYKEWKENQG